MVSTKDNGLITANQRRQLRAFALKRRWTVVRVSEETTSGRKGESNLEALRGASRSCPAQMGVVGLSSSTARVSKVPFRR